YSRTFAGRSEKRHENKRKSLWWCGREDSEDLHQERCKYWTSGKRTDVLCTRLLYSLILGFAPISSKRPALSPRDSPVRFGPGGETNRFGRPSYSQVLTPPTPKTRRSAVTRHVPDGPQ